jgi:small subunit ribosomal protein S16
MVAIRLRREGNKNRPFYRIVAIHSARARDAGYLECVGQYDPHKEGVNYTINLEATDKWIQNGAQPSETVASIIKKARRAAKAAAPAT